MTSCARLLVLAFTKVGETQLVVHTLSREYGRRGFIISAKGNGAALQPLSIIEAEIKDNPKSELSRLHNVVVVHPLSGIRNDMLKGAISLFMSEVFYRILREGDFEDGLFEWAEKSVLTLDSLGSEGRSNYHLRFLLELCSALGFRPSEENIAPFAGAQFRNISSLVTLPLAQSLMLPLSAKDRDEIATAILSYLSFHTESNINIRSLSVLHDICPDLVTLSRNVQG